MKSIFFGLLCMWAVVETKGSDCVVAAVCDGKAEYRVLPTKDQGSGSGKPSDPCAPAPGPVWFSVSGNQYRIVEAKADWKTAREICGMYDADIPHKGIRTQSALNELANHLRKRGEIDGFWVGLTDIKKEGDWKWADGRSLSDRSIWGGGQPDNWQQNQHCGRISRDNGYKIDDGECYVLFQVLCEL